MNKKILVLVLGIFGIIAVTSGVTLAFFSYSKTGTRLNQISSGSITFKYTEGNRKIEVDELMPMTDIQGKNQTNYFEFTVSSKTSSKVDIPYDITVRKATGNNILPDNIIKIYLTKVSNGVETEVLVKKVSELSSYTNSLINIPVSEKLLYNGMVLEGTNNYTETYRLRIWIDESAEYISQTSGQDIYPLEGKSYSLTVNVYGEGNVTDYKQIKSIQDFLNAASTGGNYRLMSNIDISSESVVNINKNLTLNFNGKTITSDVNQIVVGDNSTLIIDTDNGGGISCTRGCIKVDGGNVAVNNGTITSSDTTRGSGIWVENGNLVFKNGYINAGSMGISAYNSSSVIIEGGHIKSYGPVYAVVLENASFRLDNGWIDGVRGGIAFENGSTGVINGGYVTSHDVVVNGVRSNANYYALYMDNADVTINGGYFYSESIIKYAYTVNVYYDQNQPGTLTINHGYFNSNTMLESYGLTQLATPITDTEHNAVYNYSK